MKGYDYNTPKMESELSYNELKEENERLKKALLQYTNDIDQQLLHGSTVDGSISRHIIDGFFAHSHLLLVLIDTDFNMVKVNNAFCKANQQKELFFLNKNIFQLFSLEEYRLHFDQVLETGRTWIRQAKLFPVLPEDMEEKFYDWIISAIEDDEGAIIGLLLSLHDVTPNERRKIELVQAKESAEENNRLKSAFLANISHEIRTPLSGIVSYASMMGESWVTEAKRDDYINIINQSSGKLLHAIDSIIEISEIQAHQIKPDIQEISFNILLHDLYLDFYDTATERSIELKLTDKLKAANSKVYTDRQKVHAVFSNLLRNALKFTSDGEVEYGAIDHGTFLECYIKDTGIGIRQEAQEQIFNYYQNNQYSGIANSDGVGLGLAISKGYVELLGGTIRVESVFGQGTTIIFTLPK